jgi:hypothetical protein
MRRPIYSLEELDFIMKNAEGMTATEIAVKLRLSLATVYNIGSKNGLTFKKARKLQKYKSSGVRGPYERRDAALAPEPKRKPIERPPATYSNTGFIQTTQKYCND